LIWQPAQPGRHDEEKVMRYRYLESDDFSDPIPNVTDSLKKKIKAINCVTVRHLRVTEDQAGWIRALDDTATKIFHLLAPGWEQQETYESLWHALYDAVKTSLACVNWAYHMSGRDQDWFFGSCVLWFLPWRIDVERRLDSEAERVLTLWWERQGEINPTAPSTPPAPRTREPQTPTCSRINAYLNRVEAETGEKVYKRDFWLRPTTLQGVSLYNSDREFRDFQREEADLSGGCRKRFLAVLDMPPQVFIEGRIERRRANDARKRAKSRR
jgi:hypothetical protein